MLNKLLIALLLNSLAFFSLHAEEVLVLNTAFGPPLVNPDHQGALDVLYRTLGRHLGIDIQIEIIPAERALMNANVGIEDGDTCRIAGLGKLYPDLVQIPEEILHLQMSVFTKLPDLKFNGLDSLKPYHVGYLIGWKILESKVVGTKAVTRFATDKDLFRALEEGLIDVAIYEKLQGDFLIRKGSGVRVLEPPLFKPVCYLYLNKKHSVLIPLISEELKKMKQDGSMRKIFYEALLPYLNGESN